MLGGTAPWVPGRMVDGSVIAEIVEQRTRAVMQRMFDGAGQQVCGDGRETMCRRKRQALQASCGQCRVPSLGCQRTGPEQQHTRQGQQTTKWNKGEMDEQQPTEHVQQQQQQQQHKVTWAAVVAQKAPPQQRHRPCRGHRSVLQGGTRRHRDARTRK
ncbi:hypothetical protein ERJ75_001300300 [Trypanosoma vivax]|nr:hypothetical protein ERJ75_001300300 [Trypanosoma vivax]